MLRTFSKWCASLLFGLGLTATAHADNLNHPYPHHDGFHGYHHDGGGYDGGYYNGGFCGEQYGCWESNDECCCWKGGCFGLQVDALSWTARQDCLHFGEHEETVTTVSGQTTTRTDERILRPNFSWDAGVRVGLHYLQPSSWDIGLIYTRFNSETSRSAAVAAGASTANDRILIENDCLDILEDFNSNFQNAHASWELDINYLDLDFARTICCNSCLKVKPHFGARAFWMQQNFRIRGETFAGIGGATQNDFLKTHFKEHYWGYGVEGGIWADMALGCGVSLVGHFGGSILYSKFDTSSFGFEEIFVGTSPGTLDSTESKDHIRTGIPSLDYFLGLEYTGCCCGNGYTVRAGWEQHVYFNMNQLGGCCGGNLSLQGLTFSGELDF